MTTIAYLDGVFAYDSRITSGGDIITDKYQKKQIRGGVTFLLAGCVPDFEPFMQAYLAGCKVSGLNVRAFVVKTSGITQASACDDEMWESPVHKGEPMAIGSGAAHAVTAMDCGLSPVEAVRMAMKRDSCTGGTIRTFKV